MFSTINFIWFYDLLNILQFLFLFKDVSNTSFYLFPFDNYFINFENVFLKYATNFQMPAL